MTKLYTVRTNRIKKFISITLTLIVLSCLFNFNTSTKAYDGLSDNEIIISESTEYFEDGSSITTTLTQYVCDYYKKP